MPQGVHIGGLVAVAFDPTGEYLLAISHSGRGVFSTRTWERLARDYEPAYPINGKSTGIGPIQGAEFDVVPLESDTAAYATSPDGLLEVHCESSYIAVVRDDRPHKN